MNDQSRMHEKRTLNLCEAIETLRRNPRFNKAGAMATFIGVVRGENLDGEKVQRLEVQAYEEKAREVLSTICDDLKKRAGIVDVQIHHFTGTFCAGEDLVYVLVAGAHRKIVFDVLEEAVERYKKEAPIFKKEYVISSTDEERSYWATEKKQNK